MFFFELKMDCYEPKNFFQQNYVLKIQYKKKNLKYNKIKTLKTIKLLKYK